MHRLLSAVALALASLVVAGVAVAAGPSPGVLQGGDGLLAAGGGIRYVAVRAGGGTAVEALGTADGRLLHTRFLPGAWGIPLVAFDGTAGGLSADGSTLVLGEPLSGGPLKQRSGFTVLGARNLHVQTSIELRGDFAYDALAPNGARLYLIQHLSASDVTRYVVRAYDLRRHRLLPGWIADRRQRGWVMRGMPVGRVSSPDGRWAYTLYLQDGGFPFVHALDTARGVAHCIGVPWRGSDSAVWNMRLHLRGGGRSLAIDWKSGRRFLAIDTSSWRISRPTPAGGGGFPWWALGAALGGLVPLLAVGALTRRRVARLLGSLRPGPASASLNL